MTDLDGIATRETETGGLILAGGLARRMGGGDKSLRSVAGKPLLAHVIERLQPSCAVLVLNANGDAGRFAEYNLPVVADDVPGFAGPLAGILAGLDWMAAHASRLPWMVSVAADTPFVPRDLVDRLHAARRSQGTLLACAGSAGRTHPVIGLWPTSLRADLRHTLIEREERKVAAFTGRYGVAVAEWPTHPIDPFFNVNTLADLEAAEALAGRHHR